MKKTYEIKCYDLNAGGNDTVFYNNVEGVNNSTWRDIKVEMYDHDRQEALLIETLESVIGEKMAWEYEFYLKNDREIYDSVPLKDLFNKDFMLKYIKQNYNY